jgi:hypothetical protein
LWNQAENDNYINVQLNYGLMFMLFNATFNNISIISCGRDARTISINVKYIFLVYQLELTRTGNFKPSFVKIRPVVAKLWPFQIPDPPPPFCIPRWPPGKTPFSTLFHG